MLCFAYRVWDTSPKQCFSPACDNATWKDLICSLFVLLLLQQTIRRNTGTDRQKVPLKSAHQMENKVKKKSPPVKKTKIELKLFGAGPATWWQHNQHGRKVQIQLSSFQASRDWEPYTPAFRKEALSAVIPYWPLLCEGRHNAGYLQQPCSSKQPEKSSGQITPQANSGMRTAYGDLPS